MQSLTWHFRQGGSVYGRGFAEGKYSRHFNQSSLSINIRQDTCRLRFPIEKVKNNCHTYFAIFLWNLFVMKVIRKGSGAVVFYFLLVKMSYFYERSKSLKNFLYEPFCFLIKRTMLWTQNILIETVQMLVRGHDWFTVIGGCGCWRNWTGTSEQILIILIIVFITNITNAIVWRSWLF